MRIMLEVPEFDMLESNDQRAAITMPFVLAFRDATCQAPNDGEPLATILVDLISDLLHLADRLPTFNWVVDTDHPDGVSVVGDPMGGDEAIDKALHHYREERFDEEELAAERQIDTTEQTERRKAELDQALHIEPNPRRCPGSGLQPDREDGRTSAWSGPCPDCDVIIRRMTNDDGTLFVHELPAGVILQTTRNAVSGFHITDSDGVRHWASQPTRVRRGGQGLIVEVRGSGQWLQLSDMDGDDIDADFWTWWDTEGQP